jgi:hypothetical protein
MKVFNERATAINRAAVGFVIRNMEACDLPDFIEGAGLGCMGHQGRIQGRHLKHGLERCVISCLSSDSG